MHGMKFAFKNWLAGITMLAIGFGAGMTLPVIAATNFPSTLDSYATIDPNSPQNNPSHTDVHNNVHDALEALETKVGADNSTVTSTFDYKLQTVPAPYKAVATASGSINSCPATGTTSSGMLMCITGLELASFSGATVHAQDELTSSGSLTVEGNAVLNGTVTVGGVEYTFPSGDGSASGKVLKTDGDGQLSWSADGAEGALTPADADARYFQKQGGTITGSTIIDVAGGGLALEVSGTLSGTYLQMSSGSLSIGGLKWNWPSSYGTVDYVLKTDGAGNLSWVALPTGGGGTSEWGDESDGDVEISGNTTLSANMQYGTLQVNTGVTLTTDGYLLQATNLIVYGTIDNSGSNGSNGNAGSNSTSGSSGGKSGGSGGAGGAATGNASAPLPQGLAGMTGGTGGTGGNASGDAPGNYGGKNNGTNVANGVGTDGCTGGAGGDGGGTTNGTAGGGTPGTVSIVAADLFDYTDRVPYLDESYEYFDGSAQCGSGQGGAGGQGSNYWGEGGAGGGGSGGNGSNGGVLYIAAQTITGNGTISANGGDGGNGGNGGYKASGNAPSSGGGGGAGGSGGNGGVVLMVYTDLTGFTGTITAAAGNGGTQGSGGSPGGSSGSAGVNGNAGKIFYKRR